MMLFFTRNLLCAAILFLSRAEFRVIVCLRSGSDLNAVDNYGDTALKKAAFSGCADVLKLLLSSGANTDICDGFMKSPLYAAPRTFCYSYAEM